MLRTNQKVAIIGAGPVGLTMATLLQQNGADVTVYERDKNRHARIWGGTLDLHEHSGQQALKQAGLLERYLASAIPMGRTITDEQGNPLFTVAPQQRTPEINRNALRTILLDSITTDTVVWDSKLLGLETHQGKWRLHFENKPDATADVVIGANGGLSTIRAHVTDAETENTGTFIIQGEVQQPEVTCPAFYQLCHDSILMTAGKGTNLVANPRNNGALSYNVTFSTPEAWRHEPGLNFHDLDSVRAFLSNRLSHCQACYHALFQATSLYVGLPTRRIPLDEPWKANRALPITLIGDAAHIMPPFAGEGVNTGLLDAAILSHNLTHGRFNTLEDAIYDYERQMMAYAAKAQRETSKNEIAMNHPDFSFLTRFTA